MVRYSSLDMRGIIYYDGCERLIRYTREPATQPFQGWYCWRDLECGFLKLWCVNTYKFLFTNMSSGRSWSRIVIQMKLIRVLPRIRLRRMKIMMKALPLWHKILLHRLKSPMVTKLIQMAHPEMVQYLQAVLKNTEALKLITVSIKRPRAKICTRAVMTTVMILPILRPETFRSSGLNAHVMRSLPSVLYNCTTSQLIRHMQMFAMLLGEGCCWICTFALMIVLRLFRSPNRPKLMSSFAMSNAMICISVQRGCVVLSIYP